MINGFIDVFNKNAFSLREKKLFLFDLDGTVYNEGVLLDGAKDLFSLLTKQHKKFVFITNNSSKSIKDYVKHINSLGVPATEENFCTSSQVSAYYLKKHFDKKYIYCQGTNSLLNELKAYGLKIVNHDDLEKAEVILVGFDTELTSSKLYDTCKLVTRGLPYFATNQDLVCPVSFGYIPDCGSICMIIENATGRKPLYMGKPDKFIVELALHKFGHKKSEAIIVGDRLYTDIATGINANIDSICVLSGESKFKDVLNSSIKPTFTLNSIKEIYNILSK